MTLTPITDADWPVELSHLKDSFVGRANVYRVMANHPALLAAWTEFRNHVVLETALGRELSEVAILRIGHRLGSSYEWAHHIVRGRDAGLSDARILSLRGAPGDMAPADALIARGVDALLDRAGLASDLRDELTALVGAQGVLDLMATVGMYSTLAFILNTYDPPLDAEIAATLAGAPIEG